MNRAESVADSMVKRLFEGRKGHGGGACSRRVLWPDELREIVKAAYEIGWKDAGGTDRPGERLQRDVRPEGK